MPAPCSDGHTACSTTGDDGFSVVDCFGVVGGGRVTVSSGCGGSVGVVCSFPLAVAGLVVPPAVPPAGFPGSACLLEEPQAAAISTTSTSGTDRLTSIQATR